MMSPDRLGLCLFTIMAAVIAARLPTGLDLSDESYYAIFLDDWLKGGIASSTLLTLHQTAALLIYPFARTYAAIVGSTDGLLLALRTLFLLGSLAMAASWIVFLRRVGLGFGAWLAGTVLVAFIPFGLPAPSYNTIGQQGLAIALAGLGSAALAGSRRERIGFSAISVAACAIASVAYPPLTLPIGAMLALAIARPIVPRPFVLATAVALAGALAWIMVFWILTPQRIWDSVVYLSAINDPGGLSKKLAFSAALFARNPLFIALGAAAVVLGIVRNRLPPGVTALGLAALMIAIFAHPTVLFAKSHDAVTIAALGGIALLSGLRRTASRRDRIVAILYATSLIAAAATAAAATFPIYTICIGGLPAAMLALCVHPAKGVRAPDWARFAPLAAIMPSLLATSLFAPYGEIPSGEPRRWIEAGFFSGLLAKPRDIAAIELVRAEVEPLLGTDRTIAAFGRLPGLVLASSARLRAPTSFPLMPDVPQRGLEATRAFYEPAANRPAIVLVYRDPYFQPTNPMGADFDRWYVEQKRVATPLGEIEIYRRK